MNNVYVILLISYHRRTVATTNDESIRRFHLALYQVLPWLSVMRYGQEAVSFLYHCFLILCTSTKARPTSTHGADTDRRRDHYPS